MTKPDIFNQLPTLRNVLGIVDFGTTDPRQSETVSDV